LHESIASRDNPSFSNQRKEHVRQGGYDAIIDDDLGSPVRGLNPHDVTVNPADS
jgi:hypothetical protein